MSDATPDTLTPPTSRAGLPETLEQLLERISEEYERLPRQLKSIAKYVTTQSERVMVDRISDIASHCNVHPSAIVRFSQRFGFKGFTEMQALFREDYTLKTSPVLSYQQRIRKILKQQNQGIAVGDLAHECINATRSGLDRLSQELDEAAFAHAIELMEEAEHIYVVGVRRSYAVADYLVYSLQHTRKYIHLVSGIGGSYRDQMRSIQANDLIIGISFSPYGQETQQCVQYARHKQAKSLIITDNQLAPLAKDATALLMVNEGSAFAFRSLSATLCLCQALFLGLASRMELNPDDMDKDFGIAPAP